MVFALQSMDTKRAINTICTSEYGYQQSKMLLAKLRPRFTCCKALRAASLSRSLWRLASAAASATAAASALLRASSAALASACNRALSVMKIVPQYTVLQLAYQPKYYQFHLTFPL